MIHSSMLTNVRKKNSHTGKFYQRHNNFNTNTKRTKNMATFFSIFVTLFLFSKIDWVQNHQALVIIENFPDTNEVTLPFFKLRESDKGKIVYPNLPDDERQIQYSCLCPVETPENLQFVQDLAKQFPEKIFLLEKNSSKDHKSYCEKEITPVFTKLMNKDTNKGNQCGQSSDHIIHHFGFQYLQVILQLGEDSIKRIKTQALYNVCFNTTDLKPLWTQHRLSSSLMLQEPGLPSQRIQPPYKFSTENYALPKDTFLKIAKDYKENEKELEQEQAKHSSMYLLHRGMGYFLGTQTYYKMIPQMLVPQEDLALKIWKKCTTHYVNTAPLWDKLVPLMKAINDGIRKVAIAASEAINKPKTQYNEPVDIYTISFSISHRPQLKKMVNKTKHFHKHQLGLNIWCKFIYNFRNNTGVMIYLHNLPNLPPKKLKTGWIPYSKSEMVLENGECEHPVPCDFLNWADKPAGLSEYLLNYAYCCEVNKEKVKEFFNLDLKTELGLLNIDSIINKEDFQVI